MKESNVNHMKLFKSEEKEITVKMDVHVYMQLDINAQCSAK